MYNKLFSGPDFVRKHIFNKHAEKIEEVKKEVEFFNNYLRDPKRPMLETPQPKKEETSTYTHPGLVFSGYNLYISYFFIVLCTWIYKCTGLTFVPEVMGVHMAVMDLRLVFTTKDILDHDLMLLLGQG